LTDIIPASVMAANVEISARGPAHRLLFITEASSFYNLIDDNNGRGRSHELKLRRSPAVGTDAALKFEDFGSSRWQLEDKIYVGVLAGQNCNLNQAISIALRVNKLTLAL
jgi:hypothetical protein